MSIDNKGLLQLFLQVHLLTLPPFKEHLKKSCISIFLQHRLSPQRSLNSTCIALRLYDSKEEIAIDGNTPIIPMTTVIFIQILVEQLNILLTFT